MMKLEHKLSIKVCCRNISFMGNIYNNWWSPQNIWGEMVNWSTWLIGVYLKYKINSCVTNMTDLAGEKDSNKYLYENLYVNDWMMFSTSKHEIQEMSNIASFITKMFWQQISISKTRELLER